MNDFLQGIINNITRVVGWVLAAFTPFYTVITLITAALTTLAGAIADPQGWLNSSICFVIDFVSDRFPQTPANLKLTTLIASAPFVSAVGTRVITETLVIISAFAGIALVVKIYKLIPLKAT